MISTTRSPSSRGQILVIVAFAMMALIAIGAIVVDLGLSWMLRRQEQNAADPASIAAARYIEEGDSAATRTKMDTAACFYAKQNGFFNADNDTCDTARGEGRLQVHWPPISGPFAARPEMVQVVIRAAHTSFFGQFLGRPTITVRTAAVAARESTSANTNSLVALNPHDCASGKIHGGGTVTIEPVENPDTPGIPFNGGYVHVNSDCLPDGAYNDDCGNGNGAFKQGGNGGSTITAPYIYIVGTCQEAGGEVASPVSEGADPAPDPMSGLYGPAQQGYPAGYCPKKQGQTIIYVQMTPTQAGCSWNQNGTTITMTPGVYYGGWKFSGKDVTVKLLPGIYIIAGGGVSITGPDLDSTPASVGGGPDPALDPARILIFSTDNTTDPGCDATIGRCLQGSIKISGKSSLRLWGLDSGQWRGLLMWQDGRGDNPTAPIEIVGQGALDIAGTIYAPFADVKISGNGDSTAVLAVQIISWTWDIGGNGNVYMPYDPSQLYQITQQGLVD